MFAIYVHLISKQHHPFHRIVSRTHHRLGWMCDPLSFPFKSFRFRRMKSIACFSSTEFKILLNCILFTEFTYFIAHFLLVHLAFPDPDLLHHSSRLFVSSHLLLTRAFLGCRDPFTHQFPTHIQLRNQSNHNIESRRNNTSPPRDHNTPSSTNPRPSHYRRPSHDHHTTASSDFTLHYLTPYSHNSSMITLSPYYIILVRDTFRDLFEKNSGRFRTEVDVSARR